MKRLMLAAGVVLSVGANALAQDAGQIGVTLGYPQTVGVIWHATDRVAVRPEVSFVHGSTDRPATSSVFDGLVDSGESSSTSVTAGVSGLFYFGKWDHLRAFVSPRYTYGHNSSSSGSTFGLDSHNTTYAVIGSFGAQYQLHHRFAVFGETGLGYTHSRSTLTSTISIIVGPNVPAPVSRSDEVVSHNWATRSGAGVIFYLK